ncbi:MAG TPA: site-specific integrase, partial [Polyangiaceae bacterium]|nr:site-specific integrase [Polyangiaceae bacterium]
MSLLLRKAIAQFLVHLEGERRASPHTVSAYRRDLGQLCDYIEERLERPPLLVDVDILMLRGFFGKRTRGAKASTIARKMAAARSFYRYLEKRRLT